MWAQAANSPKSTFPDLSCKPSSDNALQKSHWRGRLRYREVIGERIPRQGKPAPLLAQLPRSPSDRWPAGEPFVRALAHGSMSVELFAPNELDRQKPHAQDELTSSSAATRR